jgi:hypothetical protein
VIRYIDNGKKQTILLLHGLACDTIYFDNLISELSSHYNFILPELSGHYRSSDAPISIKNEVDSIIKYCDTCKLKFQMILAHSMGSILAFELDKKIAGIDKILLLEGNLIESDFVWSTQMSTMTRECFEKYWDKFIKQYPLLLKMKVKKNNLDKYLSGVNNFNPYHIFLYSKLISKCSNLKFKNSYSKTIYFESDGAIDANIKKVFCCENNIKYNVIYESGHYMMIDAYKQISDIIKEG